MRHLGAALRIHFDQATFARCETGSGQIKIGGVALAPGRNEHIAHRKRRAGGQREGHVARPRRIAARHFFFPDKMHAGRGHRALDVFGNFAIKKCEKRIASVNEMHLNSERGESAGIFRTDHAGADNGQSLRERADLENFVGIMHAGMLERKLRRAHRRRPGSDKNFLTAQQSIWRDAHGVGVDKSRCTMKRLDLVAAHLLFPVPAFVSRDVRLVAHEICDGRLAPKREIHAKELARTHAGKGQRGLAQSLARDRAGVDPGATDLAKFFRQRHAPAKNPRRIRSADSCRSAADHHEVESLSLHSLG